MCEPISLGIATAATGIVGAAGAQQSQNAQVAAANRASIKNYKYQEIQRNREYLRSTSLRQNQNARYQGVLGENRTAEQRAFNDAQYNLNQEFDQAAFNNQDALVAMLQADTPESAGLATGRSTDRLAMQPTQQFQRYLSGQQQNLDNAVGTASRNMADIRRQRTAADMNAWRSVSIPQAQPLSPPPPTMQQGPSSLGLLTGIVEAGLGGLNTYQDLKAPNFNRQSLSAKTPTGYLNLLNDGPDPMLTPIPEFDLAASQPGWGEY